MAREGIRRNKIHEYPRLTIRSKIYRFSLLYNRHWKTDGSKQGAKTNTHLETPSEARRLDASPMSLFLNLLEDVTTSSQRPRSL